MDPYYEHKLIVKMQTSDNVWAVLPLVHFFYVCGLLVWWIFVNHCQQTFSRSCQVFACMWRLTACCSCQWFAVALWHSSSGSIVLRVCGRAWSPMLQHQPKWYSFAKQANIQAEVVPRRSEIWMNRAKSWKIGSMFSCVNQRYSVVLSQSYQRKLCFCG